jgi:LPXTG-motif cell wall-anchored protein
MPSYPFTTVDNSSFPFGQGMLGLASDSRFLEVSVASNKTPSHTWGFDYGTTGVYAAGELVVGGYNRARADMTKAQNFSIFADKSIPCPLQITVDSVKLDDTALSTKSFVACVEPAYWTLIMPREVQRNFNVTLLESHSNLVYKNQTWEYMYFNSTRSDFPTTEEMTLDVSGGLQVTIPNNELFFREKVLRFTGGWDFVKNGMQATMGTAAYADREPIVYLGAPFLSQVYLGVDYENGTFFLAPIKRSDNKELVVLGCPLPASSSSDGKNNTGAIVGGVVGGILGLVLIAAGVFFFLRRRKHGVKAPVTYEDGPQLTGYKAKYEQQGQEGLYSPQQGYVDNTLVPPAYQTPQMGGGEIFEAPADGREIAELPTGWAASPTTAVSPVSEIEGQNRMGSWSSRV